MSEDCESPSLSPPPPFHPNWWVGAGGKEFISFQARDPALPIGCAVIVCSHTESVCGYFWFSYRGGGTAEPSQNFTKKIDIVENFEKFGSVTLTELQRSEEGGGVTEPSQKITRMIFRLYYLSNFHFLA